VLASDDTTADAGSGLSLPDLRPLPHVRPEDDVGMFLGIAPVYWIEATLIVVVIAVVVILWITR
jgi:hypothetical protein